MFERFRGRSGGTPPVVLNLLIINVLLFFATSILTRSGIDLVRLLGLYYPGSEHFHPYQLLTHMFMHANLTHLFFNMFALWMFGKVLESVWRSSRFLFYYFVTGFGAAALHLFVNWLSLKSVIFDASQVINAPTPDAFLAYLNEHFPQYIHQLNQFVGNWMSDPTNGALVHQGAQYTNELLQLRIGIPTIGASGAVFGILLAFGMLFPNTRLMLLFPPIPIKAKWFVIGYGLIEFFAGVSNRSGDNVAHFAHLGGMVFGLILILYWRKFNRKNFY